jgi:cytochrome c556
VECSERADIRATCNIWFEEDEFKRYAFAERTKTAAPTLAAESVHLKRLQTASGQRRNACTICHKAFRKD